MAPYHGNHKKKKRKTKHKQSSTDRLAEALSKINHEVVELQRMFPCSQIFKETEDQGHGIRKTTSEAPKSPKGLFREEFH